MLKEKPTIVELSKLTGYKTIREKLNDKKHSLQFLPIKLKELSKTQTFLFNNQKLKTSYVVDIIHNLILKYYFKKENKFHLSSTILKEKYGHLYNNYIDFLLQYNVISVISNYRVGKNTRIYKINDDVLKDKIFRYSNEDKILLKKYKNNVSQIEETGIKNQLIDDDVKIKLVNDLFYVDIEFERSIFYLDAVMEMDGDIYNKNKYSVECINDKHIFYHFDNYGRLHTNFTILKSFIRKNCLTIDGEQTIELDINNSQPLFLTKIINESNTKWVDNDEFELFKKLTLNGKYYEYIMNCLGIKDKKIAKELTYKVLFGRNIKKSKSDIQFSKIFPTIHNFIKLYKKDMGDYKVLAYELQRLESNLIFNKIIKTIMIEHPEIKVITVHDSIVTQASHKEKVQRIFNEKILEEFYFI